MDFSPLVQGLTSPPYAYENHAPSQFSCREHSWLEFILFKDAYLHDDKT